MPEEPRLRLIIPLLRDISEEEYEIARIFRVPPHMVGDLEKSSFSNIEQQSLEFVKYTLDPWVARWEQAMVRALCPKSCCKKHFH